MKISRLDHSSTLTAPARAWTMMRSSLKNRCWRMTSVTSTSDSTRPRRRVESMARPTRNCDQDLWCMCECWPMVWISCVTATSTWNDCQPTPSASSNFPPASFSSWSTTTQAHEMFMSTVKSRASSMPPAPWFGPEAALYAACCISHTTSTASRKNSITWASSYRGRLTKSWTRAVGACCEIVLAAFDTALTARLLTNDVVPVLLLCRRECIQLPSASLTSNV
mmetsp:Transcript_39000/g.111621  ORF Transcript_39000/g.111621 Transcript_39000/m.111621 type:complete len:223 (-) Transcript_39000:557-1225(-)